jgi:hypothetical protein
MSWSKFVLAGGFESRESQWIRSIFHSLMAATSDPQREDMALYVTKDPAAPAVLYFSPLANRRMRAAVSRFIFTDCDRPETRTVELVEGEPLAWMTEWHDLTESERESYRALALGMAEELAGLFEDGEAGEDDDGEVAA